MEIGISTIANYEKILYTNIHSQNMPHLPMCGMLDLSIELKVTGEFWVFPGGEGSYNHLLDILERVGVELRSETDEYFQKFSLYKDI